MDLLRRAGPARGPASPFEAVAEAREVPAARLRGASQGSCRRSAAALRAVRGATSSGTIGFDPLALELGEGVGPATGGTATSGRPGRARHAPAGRRRGTSDADRVETPFRTARAACGSAGRCRSRCRRLWHLHAATSGGRGAEDHLTGSSFGTGCARSRAREGTAEPAIRKTGRNCPSPRGSSRSAWRSACRPRAGHSAEADDVPTACRGTYRRRA